MLQVGVEHVGALIDYSCTWRAALQCNGPALGGGAAGRLS